MLGRGVFGGNVVQSRAGSVIFAICMVIILPEVRCILYPRESESREVTELGGRWKFRIDDSATRNESFLEKWWNVSFVDSGVAIDMPVPASYNDITQSKKIRDFIGWAWYQKEFFTPNSWSSDHLVWLRIGSAHYNSIVWVNSVQVMTHEGGHLPFEAEVSDQLLFGKKNIVTVAINNTLTPTTLPPGTIEYMSEKDHYPPGYFVQNVHFDFFNYAGIHRPVKLYTTPKVYIQDVAVTVACDAPNTACSVKYSVQTGENVKKHAVKHETAIVVSVALLERHGKSVASSQGDSGVLMVSHPHLWWPIGMNESVAYLYTLEVKVLVSDKSLIDVYRLPVGIRTVEVKETQFLINGKPFYFLGVGKHEDWDVRGKGFDWASILKDFNMLEWMGANSFRTSHYPYSEEIMQICDERGFVVVDECPAIGLRDADNFVAKTMGHHLRVMEELVDRDKNHPSVVMWSVANEPKSSLAVSKTYFETVIAHTKHLDSTRPVTFVCNEGSNTDLATEFVDVLSVNRYEGWYQDSGHTEVIKERLGYFLDQWFETRHKPVIQMEWGTNTVAGLHQDPSVMYTEEYQEDVMREHFKVFDSLRSDFLVGEMIWNFADFASDQGVKRIAGNRYGILTRQRQPKSAAFAIRKRYHSMRNQTVHRYA